MEILNNFASIYCFIAFVIGALFMLAILSIAAMGKDDEPRNKVLISEEELQYLRACDFTLHQVNNVVGLCPACKKAILVNGLVCLNCGYHDSYTLEEWQQIKEQ